MYEELIEPNINLVRFIVNKFHPHRSDTEDYMQIGFIGLIKSAKSFRGGSKFSVFAYKGIYWEILKYHKKQKMLKNDKYLDSYINNAVSKVDLNSLCLDFLNQEEQCLLFDIYVLEKSVGELSKELNISKSTIYRQFNNIKKKIKDNATK